MTQDDPKTWGDLMDDQRFLESFQVGRNMAHDFVAEMEKIARIVREPRLDLVKPEEEEGE